MRTIWSPAGLRSIPVQDRFMVLYVYPLIYGVNVLSYLAIGSAAGGSKVMRLYLGEWGSLTLTALTGLSALGGLLGLALIRHAVERFCAIVMVASIVAYLILLCFALGGGSSPLSSLAGTAISTVLIAVRVQQVSKDLGRKKANRPKPVLS